MKFWISIFVKKFESNSWNQSLLVYLNDRVIIDGRQFIHRWYNGERFHNVVVWLGYGYSEVIIDK